MAVSSPVLLEEDFHGRAVTKIISKTVDQVSYSGFQKESVELVEFSNQQAPFFGSPLDASTSQHPMNGLKYLPAPQAQSDADSDRAMVADDSEAAGGNYFDDLNNLVDDQPSDSAGNSYLSDLNQLLGDQPAWILTHGQLLDLGPDQSQQAGSEMTFLNELQSLVGDTHVLADCRRVQGDSALMPCATTGSMRPTSASIPASQERYYEIPREQPCQGTGTDSVTGLFTPIGEIKVSGVSSSPPQPAKNSKVASLALVRPPNKACSYLQFDIPMHYLTSGYGVRRAPRNTQRFCHNPLYFEDPNLERCGQSRGCLTTASSMIHFTAMASLLPYLTTADPPRSCVQALPDCPTCHSYGTDAYLPEWSWKAATVQAAAVTGLVFVIP